MEYCEGGSLDAVYKEVKKLGGRTGEKVLGKVAEGVLQGLTYLNSRKIIHRGEIRTYCRLAIFTDHVQTSNHPTFCYAVMVRSSFVTSESVESLAPKATRIHS